MYSVPWTYLNNPGHQERLTVLYSAPIQEYLNVTQLTDYKETKPLQISIDLL